MMSLCETQDQRDHLQKLLDLVANKTLRGSDAWTTFSRPDNSFTFRPKSKKPAHASFTDDEIASYVAIKKATHAHLYTKYGAVCAYCRRIVGHYGFGWHIEHVFPKRKFPEETFNLANLTIGCVDCNGAKMTSVDNKMKTKTLPIINPVADGFRYADHLRYVHLATESLSFALYTPLDGPGLETYERLRFKEIERSFGQDYIDGHRAARHAAIRDLKSSAADKTVADPLVKLMDELQTGIYRKLGPGT